MAEHADLYRDGRVDREAYRSAEVFASEMDAIFESSWVFVTHESLIPDPGDFRTTFIGPNPVIAVRG